MFTISSATANVSLSKLTMRNSGTGVSNEGKLTINYSTISGNGGYAQNAGGGIYNTGPLTVNNSTISQNAAYGVYVRMYGIYFPGNGGGISNSGGTVTITNSTITENSVHGGFGGGISDNPRTRGTVRINNNTISRNAAYKVCIRGHCYGGSGGISGSATLQNSIVANSPNGGNCVGTMTSNGYNLSSDGTCNFSNHGDRNGIDPKLGTLGNNGGPTETIPLLPGSPAIDAGNPSGCTDGQGNLLKTDQRGQRRPDSEDKTGCDMGAYERQSD